MKCNGAPDKNRTCGLQLRRLSLYPTELRAQSHIYICRIAWCQVFYFYIKIARMRKIFASLKACGRQAQEQMKLLCFYFSGVESARKNPPPSMKKAAVKTRTGRRRAQLWIELPGYRRTPEWHSGPRSCRRKRAGLSRHPFCQSCRCRRRCSSRLSSRCPDPSCSQRNPVQDWLQDFRRSATG